MKNFKSLTTINVVVISLLTVSSCNLLNRDSLQEKVIPEEAKPSAEMTYGNLVDESHADLAVKYIITDLNSPYESIELFGDGTYLIAQTGAGSVSRMSKVVVRRSENGVMASIPKQSASKLRSGNDWFIVGGYIMNEEGSYTLEDFGSLKVKEEGGDINLTFENTYGDRICTVFASEVPPVDDKAAKSLCRTWNMESLEQWVYLGVVNVLNLKYVGGSNPHYEGKSAGSLDEETKAEMINSACSTITFSPSGTYFCTYNNGEILYSTWMWANEEQGTLFYDWKEGENEEGYVTVRFADDRCLIYEDYTVDLSDMIEGDDMEDIIDISQYFGNGESNLRYLLLNTLKAKNTL